MKKPSNRIFKPGNRYLIIYLTFLSAFPPLTIDMYLPALPNIAVNLSTTNEVASYSLSAFFLVYAFATLFWGPVSDKYGRKPILVCGSLIYIATSILIAMASSIWQLLLLRCIQAIGCATASSMSLAIVKDVLRGPLMEKIVSWMQAAHILAPLTAPVLGGILLYLMNWRGIFITLAIMGCLALAGAFFLCETGRPKREMPIFNRFARIRTVLANPLFSKRLFLFSFLAMPFFSFLGASTFIYQNQFGLTAQTFSWFFAFNASFSLLGPLGHLFYFSRISKNKIISIEIAGIALAGALIIVIGSQSVWFFAALMIPVTFFGSAIRPPSTVLMLECIKGDNGIVASLIQFGAMLAGSLAMYIATLTVWPNPVLSVGSISFIVAGISFLLWLKIRPPKETSDPEN